MRVLILVSGAVDFLRFEGLETKKPVCKGYNKLAHLEKLTFLHTREFGKNRQIS